MNLFDLKHLNCVSVYRSICEGENTLSSISKKTGISLLTVSELANDMVKREILHVDSIIEDRAGRRRHWFEPSHNRFCVFIEKQENHFCVIGITTKCDVALRFDIPLNYKPYTIQEIYEKVIEKIENNPNYKYCMAIYFVSNDNNEYSFHKNVQHITKEDLIITSLANNEKIVLININGKQVLSVYSHLHYTDVCENDIRKVIDIDEVYNFEGELYFEIYDAIAKLTVAELEKIL